MAFDRLMGRAATSGSPRRLSVGQRAPHQRLHSESFHSAPDIPAGGRTTDGRTHVHQIAARLPSAEELLQREQDGVGQLGLALWRCEKGQIATILHIPALDHH